MTETEAKEKMCPLIFAGGLSGVSGKGINITTEEINGVTRCQASDCAMWRWYERPDFVFGKSSVEMSDPDKVITINEKVRNTDPLTGYCGLAGK